jgi:hypothetical protein
MSATIIYTFIIILTLVIFFKITELFPIPNFVSARIGIFQIILLIT